MTNRNKENIKIFIAICIVCIIVFIPSRWAAQKIRYFAVSLMTKSKEHSLEKRITAENKKKKNEVIQDKKSFIDGIRDRYHQFAIVQAEKKIKKAEEKTARKIKEEESFRKKREARELSEKKIKQAKEKRKQEIVLASRKKQEARERKEQEKQQVRAKKKQDILIAEQIKQETRELKKKEKQQARAKKKQDILIAAQMEQASRKIVFVVLLTYAKGLVDRYVNKWQQIKITRRANKEAQERLARAGKEKEKQEEIHRLERERVAQEQAEQQRLAEIESVKKRKEMQDRLARAEQEKQKQEKINRLERERAAQEQAEQQRLARIEREKEQKEKEAQRVRKPKYTQTKLIDSMESLDLWEEHIHEMTVGRVALFRGITGKGVALYFDLPDNGWILIKRRSPSDLDQYQGFRFSYLGSGSLNSLEVLFIDENDHVFGKAIPSKPASGSGWELATVNFSELTSLSGKERLFEPATIRHIGFRIRKNTGDQGGKGRIVLDNLELVK